MPIQFLIDEQLRGTLAATLIRAATKHGLKLDVAQVGDEWMPPLGTKDPELLVAAEQMGRVLISLDRKTLASHLASHLSVGRHSPGILLLRQQPLLRIADYLVLVAYASDPAEWQDRTTFVP